MVEDKRHACGQRNGPERRGQSELGNKPYGAKGEEGCVDRNPGANERFNMLSQPFQRSGIAAQHEPQICADGCEADKGNPDHHRLSDQNTLEGTICGGDQQHHLQRHVQPVAVLGVAAAIADTQSAIPGQIDGQDCEIQHHITEDAAYQSGIFEAFMMNQFRMRRDRIDDRHRRHGDGAAPGDQHHPHKGFAPSGVQFGPFLADDGDPETDQAGGAKHDVEDDKGLKEMQI